MFPCTLLEPQELFFSRPIYPLKPESVRPEADCIFFGSPFDASVTYRTGARYENLRRWRCSRYPLRHTYCHEPGSTLRRKTMGEEQEACGYWRRPHAYLELPQGSQGP